MYQSKTRIYGAGATEMEGTGNRSVNDAVVPIADAGAYGSVLPGIRATYFAGTSTPFTYSKRTLFKVVLPK
jgi:hypothetical protein